MWLLEARQNREVEAAAVKMFGLSHEPNPKRQRGTDSFPGLPRLRVGL